MNNLLISIPVLKITLKLSRNNKEITKVHFEISADCNLLTRQDLSGQGKVLQLQCLLSSACAK